MFAWFTPELLTLLLRAAILIFVLLTAFAYLTYLERRVLGWFQWRVGPNRVGPWGLLQPLADGVKTVLKQEMVPVKADKALYFMAPVLTFAASFSIFSLIPMGPKVWISNVPVAVLVFLGLSSLSSYGLILAGWASQSRYSFLGGLRTCAQVISYELGLGIALLVPIMITGSLSIEDIGNIYTNPGWNWAYLIVLFPATVLFLICALAETGRAPFDLPECESEIVAGYHTEYSSFKYAMFPMGEYVAMAAMCAIAVNMFLGGYHLPFGLDNWWGLLIHNPEAVVGPPHFLIKEGPWWNALSISALGFSTVLTFIVKVLLLIFVFMWIRATTPRVRYDQLMRLGWKVLLPAGLALIFLTSVISVFAGVASERAAKPTATSTSTKEVSLYVPDR
jgi:NADH-quinone oxidoreductase subunit H